jgi:hypothetical protein
LYPLVLSTLNVSFSIFQRARPQAASSATVAGVIARSVTKLSPLSATDEQRAALTGLASSRERGEADRARAVLLTLAGWTSWGAALAGLDLLHLGPQGLEDFLSDEPVDALSLHMVRMELSGDQGAQAAEMGRVVGAGWCKAAGDRLKLPDPERRRLRRLLPFVAVTPKPGLFGNGGLEGCPETVLLASRP